ncbi:GSCOCT00014182001.2-RA-CDS [Cotesia congregata]|uniref:Cc_bv8.1_29.12_pseudo n=1 Tax=Cotesia congregata TaxID=51543 RepID=A0A8J2HEB6_COTCN|nr:GSCOCT00014182001.2-RA-CDS [Cotesia congregata]CAG5092420.1 cc_bv8.1_29.12_pseudo [Cotesia congregata]
MEKSLIYVELTEGIYVPSRWPLSDIKMLVVALARKIIKENKNVFSILQVNGIPAELITRKNKSDDMHLFEEISGT